MNKVKMMNKKSELITLSVIILLILIGGIIYFQEKTKEQKYFVGDSLNKIVYDPESANVNCKMDQITLDSDNIELFRTMEEAIAKDYKPHKFCK